jgi:hemin uptake protein HemP
MMGREISTPRGERALPENAADPARPAEPDASKVRLIRSSELLGEAGLVRIDHEGEIYSLRRTRNGRLILTK